MEFDDQEWRMRVKILGIMAGMVLGLWPVGIWAQASDGEVVRFKGTMENVKATFGPAEPVAHVKAGGMLEANSLDCFGNVLQKPGDPFSLIKIDNPLTGPFFIDGAEPGDTLVVHILDLQVDSKQGVGTLAPGFGAVNSTHYTPMLEKEPLPERAWYYPIEAEKKLITFQATDSDFKVQFPLKPFLGCIGVAPANGEARSSIVPAEFGFELVKGNSTGWPRLENEHEIMTTGIYRPVDDAVRIAVTEMVHWMHRDYGLSELDAYELFSKVGKLHLTEMVDPNYVVVASVEKKYLPAKK